MLLTREWYMHPNGQLPAYEWAFGDVNPPVHAWAAWRVYTIERKAHGGQADAGDRQFLERVFQKLLMNFTWWVNRKDANDRNIFQGGFLGLDNIGVFDRSQPLPTGGYLEQSDATSWMAMYALNLLKIALELARYNSVYEDNRQQVLRTLSLHRLRDERNRHAYLVVERGGRPVLRQHPPAGRHGRPAQNPLDGEPDPAVRRGGHRDGRARQAARFCRAVSAGSWTTRPELTVNVSQHCNEERAGKLMLSIVNEAKLRRLLQKLLDENEFLSPYGVRSVSKYHEAHPYELPVDGTVHRVDYNPGESMSGLFGGNSNWRGPVWMPVNYLLIESLQKFHYYFGDAFQVECPTGSGQMMTLWEVAAEISRRLAAIFPPRPRNGSTGRVRPPIRNSRRTRTGTPTPAFTSIFTPTREGDAAPVIRPAGRG